MMIITKEQFARAYALMECERAPNSDFGYGHYPAVEIAKRFLNLGLISQLEWIKFVNNEFPHSDNGPFREICLDLLAMYEHQNPLPVGEFYGVSTDDCFPVAMAREKRAA